MRRTGTTISIAIFALTSTSVDRAAQADDISGDSGVFTGRTVLAEATWDTESATAARTVDANSQTDDPKTSGSGGQQTSQQAEKSLGDFKNVSIETLQSVGWIESTDTDFGGNSQASLSIVDGMNDHALQISGDTKPGYAYPWAGAMYFLDSETKQADRCQQVLQDHLRRQRRRTEIPGLRIRYQSRLQAGDCQSESDCGMESRRNTL